MGERERVESWLLLLTLVVAILTLFTYANYKVFRKLEERITVLESQR